jgi:aspartate kinase
VIAAAMNAKLLELWKDVEGFMSADPKLEPAAHHIDKLSYYEAAELSYFGARILHPRTSEPLIETNPIPINIRNIKNPDGPPTVISRSAYEKSDIVKSVTYNRDIAVLKIWGPGVGYKPGIITDISELLSGSDVNIYSIITAQTCINLLLDKNDAEFAYSKINKMSGGVIEKVEVLDNIALIGVVGEGLLKAKGLAARVFTAVAKEKVAVDMISAGASKVAYYFIIPRKDLKKTIHAIHEEYFS